MSAEKLWNDRYGCSIMKPFQVHAKKIELLSQLGRYVKGR
jgi:hypothetical protein